MSVFAEEVACSSPIGSVIEVVEVGEESELNPYGYSIRDRDDYNIKRSKGTSDIVLVNDSSSSNLLEILQSDHFSSQKTRNTAMQEVSSSPVYYEEIRSAQTPVSSVDKKDGQDVPVIQASKSYPIISSSSPIGTQETQPSTQIETKKLSRASEVAPSAPRTQTTSFRLQPPARITSERTTPRKKNVLVTQESFNIPNLISPTRYSDILDSQSLYCTAVEEHLPQAPNIVRTTKVRFKGHIMSKSSSPTSEIQTRIVGMKRSASELDEIPDSSDDEEETSLIEISRSVKKPLLQVPSSCDDTVKKKGPTSSPVKRSPLAQLDQNESTDDFEQYSTDELRQKIIQYGLKAARGRVKMIQNLKEATSFLSQESKLKLSQSQNITNSQNIIRTDIFRTMDDLVSQNLTLLEKICTWEPIKNSELRGFLDTHNLIVDDDVLKCWCDRNSVCIIDDTKEL